MTVTKLTLHWKDMNQIDTIEMLGTKLIYDVKDKNQIRSLPKKKKKVATLFLYYYYYFLKPSC